jgi:hypothetical protein
MAFIIELFICQNAVCKDAKACSPSTLGQTSSLNRTRIEPAFYQSRFHAARRQAILIKQTIDKENEKEYKEHISRVALYQKHVLIKVKSQSAQTKFASGK